MTVLALILLLAQATPSPTPVPSIRAPPQMPTPQQAMRVYRQFRPELDESHRRLMAAVTQALTPQQVAAIAADIGADAVADEPNFAALTSKIDGVLTPPARAAIAAAFVQYAARQQALIGQMQAEMPMQPSGNVHVRLLAPTPQPIAFVPADAARLLAYRPMGAGMLRPEHAIQPPPATPVMQLRKTMRGQMLAALTPAHRVAVGELYGKSVMAESEAGQNVVAQIDALLSPDERQAILGAHAQFVAARLKLFQALKATAQQLLRAMGSAVSPAIANMMKRQIDALQTPPAVPVEAGTALFAALTVQPTALVPAQPPTAGPWRGRRSRRTWER